MPTRFEFHVISLAGSSRRPAMARQLDEIGHPWSFFDACTGLPPELTYEEEEARARRGRTLTRGELGCYASHYSLWKRLVDDPEHDAYVVLEDDLLLDPVWFRRLDEWADDLAAHRYVRFYAKWPSPYDRVLPCTDRHLVRTIHRVYGTQGYFLTKEAARRFLKGRGRVHWPVDDEMDRYWIHDVPIQVIYPFPLMEVAMGSTIQDARHAMSPPPGLGRLRWYWNRLVERSRKLAYDLRRTVTRR